jgi:uncharacterized peroxidase-related enzyme
LGQSDSRIEQLIADYRRAALSQQDRAMLDYAAQLTREPSSITRKNIDTLKSAGFSDAAILDICQITCYYAFVNRLADGLGVELEAYWQK